MERIVRVCWWWRGCASDGAEVMGRRERFASGCDARRDGIRGCMICGLSSYGKLKVESVMVFSFIIIRLERTLG